MELWKNSGLTTRHPWTILHAVHLVVAGSNALGTYRNKARYWYFSNLLLNLIGIVTNSWFIYKTFKKNRRLEFHQRRDYLSQKISDLNGRLADARLISSKYVIVAVKLAGLPLQGKHAEDNTELIASIKDGREITERLINRYEDKIEEFHVKYRGLTLETDAPQVERIIATVQVASEDLRKDNSRSEANLHVLESSNEIIKTILAETDAKQRQIDLDFDRAIEKLTQRTSDPNEKRSV